VEEGSGERRRQDKDRRGLQVDRRAYKEFPFDANIPQLKVLPTIDRNRRGLRDSLAVLFFFFFSKNLMGNTI
jgi:hypothetical protein